MNLTICYVTARKNPEIRWFLDSLCSQLKRNDNPSIIIVDAFKESRSLDFGVYSVAHTPPKPTIWQGPHRITKEDWWAASNARNTGICLCRTEWIAFLDDRCVLLPGWLDSIREAMAGNYIVAGAYEKRKDMTVLGGVIRNAGIITGQDSREDYTNKFRAGASVIDAPGEWLFGCSLALPVEWALSVGGYEEEHCDGLSMEDCIFGLMLQNNSYPIKYDRRMKIIEDRTPSELGNPMRREDKGKSPDDKSHAMLAKLRGLKHTLNQFDIREVRNSVLAGNPFPAPAASHVDWYDSQPISEF